MTSQSTIPPKMPGWRIGKKGRMDQITDINNLLFLIQDREYDV